MSVCIIIYKYCFIVLIASNGMDSIHNKNVLLWELCFCYSAVRALSTFLFGFCECLSLICITSILYYVFLLKWMFTYLALVIQLATSRTSDRQCEGTQVEPRGRPFLLKFSRISFSFTRRASSLSYRLKKFRC